MVSSKVSRPKTANTPTSSGKKPATPVANSAQPKLTSRIDVGDPLPQLTLAKGDGELFELKRLLGKPFILYFYPKDDTSGCTKEACAFRDNLPAFQDIGVSVYGVSPDPVERHQRFAAKYSLPFTLLSDPERALAMQFGVYVEKVLYGKRSMGIERSTFLFDDQGKVVKVWRKVKVDGHVEAVLAVVQTLLAV